MSALTLLRRCAWVGAAWFVVTDAFLDFAVVSDASMSPSLRAGDIVAVRRGVVYDAGSVVLCKSPDVPRACLLGRLGDATFSRPGQVPIIFDEPPNSCRHVHSGLVVGAVFGGFRPRTFELFRVPRIPRPAEAAVDSPVVR